MDVTVKNERNKGRVAYASDSSVAARYKLNDIYCAAWLSHAITALAKCGVADVVQEEAMHVDQIAAKAKLHAPSLYRALRAVAANGIFCQTELGFFKHNDVSRLLRSDNPFSWRGMAGMWNHPSCLSAWGKFSEVLSDGKSGVQHAFGKTLYEHLAETPGATLAFSDAMISNSAHAAVAIAKAFGFGKYHCVMDLGGGVGTLLTAILSEHPHLQGIILEIDELKIEAENYLAAYGLSNRAQVIVGNFIELIPAKSDLYLVKNSLWNWDDAKCLAIMKNVRRSIGADSTSRFVVIEYIIDEDNATWTTLYDLQILNMPGGRARTVPEYTTLLNDSGFALERIEHVEDQTLFIAQPI